jgi:hypothetical protein
MNTGLAFVCVMVFVFSAAGFMTWITGGFNE